MDGHIFMIYKQKQTVLSLLSHVLECLSFFVLNFEYRRESGLSNKVIYML